MIHGQVQGVESSRVLGLPRSRAEGLSPEDAAERLRELGPNTVEQRVRARGLRTLARQLGNFFTLLLFAASSLCFVADRMQPGQKMAILGWALLAVSLLNALFSYFQESRAERAMEELRKLLPARVAVRREGVEQTVEAAQVVPGDLLYLREGDRVPADARLIECEALLVNNAPLTGEARAVALVATP